MRVYAASKVKHAGMWRALRDFGMPIHSSWIDEAGEGQTADHAELAMRCLLEVHETQALILFCEPGDILKGALIEAGAALALGKHVYCVGTCESLSIRTFSKHPNWHEVSTVHEAFMAARRRTWDEMREVKS